MSGDRRQIAGLLKWYPPAWRDRYGAELVALMEDGLDGQGPTPRLKLSIIRGGLRERLHAAGLIGDHSSPAEQARAGAVLVLCAWTAFVVAGASYSKGAEHFAQAVPGASRAVPQDAFSTVAALGALGVALVVLGAVMAMPAFVRFLVGGGWPLIRGRVLTAIGLTAVTVGAVIPLSRWAHHLSGFQRNGGDGVYSGVFVLWALVVVATLIQWTVVAVGAAARIDLGHRVMRLEAGLAVAVAGVMVAITAATAVWWGTMASDAPWFLRGTAPGTSPSPFTVQLVLTMALMLAAAISGGYGVLRIARSWAGSAVGAR